MIEIKFKYYYGHGDNVKKCHIFTLEDIECHEHFDIAGDILYVHQYTGLKDVDGVEIYEGDIVRHRKYYAGPTDYHGGDPSESDGMYLRTGHVSITPSKGVCINGKQRFTPDYDLDVRVDRYNNNPGRWADFAEVIGNIHQHKELLE
jgi:uncharacterized phage protein (TIGR01671 family)